MEITTVAMEISFVAIETTTVAIEISFVAMETTTVAMDSEEHSGPVTTKIYDSFLSKKRLQNRNYGVCLCNTHSGTPFI